MASEYGERTRLVCAVDGGGELATYRIVEPDTPCARAYETEAVEARNGLNQPHRAEALEALAAVCRIADASQR